MALKLLFVSEVAKWGQNQGIKLWGIRLLLLSLVFFTSACLESIQKVAEVLTGISSDNTPSDNPPSIDSPSGANKIDVVDVDVSDEDDATPIDGPDIPGIENSPVVFVPLPENQDTPIGIPNLLSTLVTVSDTDAVATVLGEGLEPGATIQFTNTTAIEREVLSQNSFMERLAFVFYDFVEVVAGRGSQPALALEDTGNPCNRPHAICVQIDENGILPLTPLFNVQDYDTFNVNYVNLTTGEEGPVVQEKVTASVVHFGQKLASPYATSHNGVSAIVQAGADGNIVEVGFDTTSGFFKVISGTLESDYSFARIPDDVLDGLTQMIYHAPTRHFILMNRDEVAIHELVIKDDGHPFLIKKITSLIGCDDPCFPTKVKISYIEKSLDFEETSGKHLEELLGITSTGIFYDLRVNYIMGTRVTVDSGMMGTLQANVGDLDSMYNSLSKIIFVSADEHFYDDGMPIRFNHAEAFDATASANNLVVQFEDGRGQKFLAVKSFLPAWVSVSSAILPVTWRKIIDLQIIKEQFPGDNEPGQALALTSDGLYPIAYDIFPKDGEEMWIAIDEGKSLKLGKDLAKMVFDDERKLVFILDFGEYDDGSSHDQKIVVIDLSDIGQPRVFHSLNPHVDPNHDGIIFLDEAIGKNLNYQPKGLELLESPNADDGAKNFLYVASNRLEGALVLNVSLDQNQLENLFQKTEPDVENELDTSFDKADSGNLDNNDIGGGEPQESIKLRIQPPVSNFEKPSSKQ